MEGSEILAFVFWHLRSVHPGFFIVEVNALRTGFSLKEPDGGAGIGQVRLQRIGEAKQTRDGNCRLLRGAPQPGGYGGIRRFLSPLVQEAGVFRRWSGPLRSGLRGFARRRKRHGRIDGRSTCGGGSRPCGAIEPPESEPRWW